MKALVMGGTQFNGLALVKELAKTGHDVTVLNRGKTQTELPRRVRRLTCDRTDAAGMRETLGREEFDCVFDISAYRPEDVELMIDIFQGRIAHYIFASSTVIYAASRILPICEHFPLDRSEQQNAYGLNKILCEDVLVKAHRSSGFPMSIAAFSMVFGPNNIVPEREQRMYLRIAQGRPVLIPGDGTTVQQVGHVYDEARALRMMALNPTTIGRRYNLTGADCYTDEGYVDTFAEVVGAKPEKIFVPPDVMDDLVEGRIDIHGNAVPVNVDTRSGDPNAREARLFQINRLMQRIAPHLHGWRNSVWFSIDDLRRDTGWAPEFTFEAAVEQTWKWMRETGLNRTREFDFGFEDDLIARIRG